MLPASWATATGSEAIVRSLAALNVNTGVNHGQICIRQTRLFLCNKSRSHRPKGSRNLTCYCPALKPCDSNAQSSCHQNPTCGDMPFTGGSSYWCSGPIRPARCCTCPTNLFGTCTNQGFLGARTKKERCRNVSDRILVTLIANFALHQCGSNNVSCI